MIISYTYRQCSFKGNVDALMEHVYFKHSKEEQFRMKCIYPSSNLIINKFFNLKKMLKQFIV
jgi:hypothetical protein